MVSQEQAEASIKASRNAGTLIPLVITALMLLFAGVLLVLYYQSSEELRIKSLERFRYDTEKIVFPISAFFTEQKDEAGHLASSREIAVFFENKALGMSMEYGLNLSLPPIANRFHELIQKKRYGNNSVYDRIALVDKHGSCLIDTNQDMTSKTKWKYYLSPRHSNEPSILFLDNNLLITVSYYFKGNYEAQLLVWLNHESIAARLFGASSFDTDRSWLILKGGPSNFTISRQKTMPFYAKDNEHFGDLIQAGSGKAVLFNAASGKNTSEDWIFTSIAVAGTPFVMVREIRQEQVLGGISPTMQLAGMITLFFMILVGAAYNIFLIVKAQKLRRNLEKSLQREVEIYKTIAEKSFTGVFVIQDGLFKYITEQAAGMYGYEVVQLMGTKPDKIVYPEDMANLHSMAAEMIRGQRTAPYEYRIVTSDNKVRWIMETMTPIVFRGRPALLGNCIDITQRRQIEVQELLSQKLESVGQLAAGIAHEINTPIQFVGDNIHFMESAFQDMLSLTDTITASRNCDFSNPSVVEEIFAEISRKEKEIDLDFLKEEIPQAIRQSSDGLHRVSKIVMAMREFSHPGGESKTDMDINAAIESTITLTKNEWKYSTDLVTDLAPDLPMIQGYPADFNQVILNLILNATQAIQQKIGKDGNDKGLIKITTRKNGNEAEICIRDTGAGIPAEVQPRVFDPFFTTKEVGKGTGQGLTIARSIIIGKHGGKLFFESKIGEGTSFYIRLPLTQD
jgi:PAS domain S-box-containing protein